MNPSMSENTSIPLSEGQTDQAIHDVELALFSPFRPFYNPIVSPYEPPYSFAGVKSYIVGHQFLQGRKVLRQNHISNRETLFLELFNSAY